MSVSFADFDGDGYMDAFVANDASPNFLFHNLGGKRFEEIGVEAGVAYNDSGNALSGMGSDFRDVNNDGLPDIWHTAVERETFPLYLGLGKTFFSATMSSGLGRSTVKMSGWATASWISITTAGRTCLSHARMCWIRWRSITTAGPTRNRMRYSETLAEARSRTSAHWPATPFKRQRRIEAWRSAISTTTDGSTPSSACWAELRRSCENVSANQNHWLLVRLIGSRSNRMGLGAQLRLVDDAGHTQWNEATTSVGYASSSDSRCISVWAAAHLCASWKCAGPAE